MRSLLMVLLLGVGFAAAQNSSPSVPAKSQKPNSNSSASDKSSAHNPNLAPPRSDSVDAASLGDDRGDSSSKDTQIDLSPPPNDAKDHPNSSDILRDERSSGGGVDTTEFHLWDPHKAAKDIEVGDYYFKRKNYIGAESRYREALAYKDNDAVAMYKLAVCLEKMNRLDEALSQYEGYLKILPYGPEAPEAKKAIERLKSPAASAKPN
jgi:tetratricopeptide (TPR) repeat protein